MFAIELKRESGQNLYNQIYEAIRAEILADLYTPDTKLPSIRKLASRLDVNPETVVKAYDLLAAENLIYKKEGSGSYIAPAASKTDPADHRLRILTSKTYTPPAENIDLRGPSGKKEYLSEYAFDLIYDRYSADEAGAVFSSKPNGCLSWFKKLKEQAKRYSFLDQHLVFNSRVQLQHILANIIDLQAEFLFAGLSDFSLLTEILQEQNQPDNLFNSVSADYEKLVDYLDQAKIDYLVISDETAAKSIFNWPQSKLNSLFELAKMLEFKLIIIQFYSLYENQPQLSKQLLSEYSQHLIVVENLTARVFPGLNLGNIYFEKEANYNQMETSSLLAKYSYQQQFKRNDFSAGDNIVNNLLSYYIDNNYLDKRIKLLAQRLLNRRLIIKEEIKAHFKEAVLKIENNALFYFKLTLNQPLNQAGFKAFAAKNSVLLPDYRLFLQTKLNSDLIVSVAALDQFELKQAVMALAKIYWQFVN
ncbi:GntR family transcriptional regulator [Halanaerobium salsuginis]|uniref:DNA-binding transcriptional regulator, MocR family, contains an aminotransferase domain n=1 Tax=Halanaerobium salsuginis TaxID=29563 RepID=A0A1I4JPS2_9FIRM|nr:GntR family transcriptional regulator [Halanaerobium salsuginis]SFL68605.1 DNA-binding transcriptional regulator, MocR family, contains an aminotransferase domain [Halanaerobium salsuginis]